MPIRVVFGHGNHDDLVEIDGAEREEEMTIRELILILENYDLDTDVRVSVECNDDYLIYREPEPRLKSVILYPTDSEEEAVIL